MMTAAVVCACVCVRVCVCVCVCACLNHQNHHGALQFLFLTGLWLVFTSKRSKNLQTGSNGNSVELNRIIYEPR